MDEKSNEITNKSIDDDWAKLINKRIEGLRPAYSSEFDQRFRCKPIRRSI